jgi:holo-[acyl-carrier protein] synthase
MRDIDAVNLRFGLDLTSVSSVRDSLAEHGDRYLERNFTPREVDASRRGGRLDPRRLAERFAVKEATLKVLSVGDEGLDFRSIELTGDATANALEVAMHGRAAELAAASGVTRLAVSITSDVRLAAAAVVAEIEEPGVRAVVSPR